jgi:hypothetical protein
MLGAKNGQMARRDKGKQRMDEKFHKEAQQVVDHNIHNYIDNAALWLVDIIKKKVADNDEANVYLHGRGHVASFLIRGVPQRHRHQETTSLE